MGLDVSFYEFKRKEIGYFLKVNFFLTYFGVTDEQNGVDLEITKDTLAEFVDDLKCELVQYKDRITKQTDDIAEVEPINPKFRTCNVPFGGSLRYSTEYWENLRRAYNWADEQLTRINWNDCDLVLNCWW